MSEIELKNNGKTGLVKSALRQPNIQAVGLLLLMAFSQLHSEIRSEVEVWKVCGLLRKEA